VVVFFCSGSRGGGGHLLEVEREMTTIQWGGKTGGMSYPPSGGSGKKDDGPCPKWGAGGTERIRAVGLKGEKEGHLGERQKERNV